MFCFKAKSSSFLILTTLILALFLSFPSPGAAENGVVSGTLASFLKGSKGVNKTTNLVLAKERTHRRDPFDDGKYYNGGWNISNPHYFYSVLNSGTPLFVVAFVWFVGFGLCLVLICMCFCCCGRRPNGYSRFAYALSLILLSLFTIGAIVGSVVLYTGQGKFHNSTTSTLDFVLRQADSTVDNLNNVSDYLAAAKKVGVDQFFLTQDLQDKIDNVNGMIKSAAKTLDSATKNNKKDIFRYLDLVWLILTVVAAVMLGLTLLGFLFSVTGLQCFVYLLVIIGWILVAATFILCGVFLVLHNVMGDTCVAMSDWVDNPTAHTALDNIIPCVDPATSREALSQSKEVTFQMVQLVNGLISNVINNDDIQPYAEPLYYNQSGPLVPLLCNPYNPDKTDRRACAAGEVDLNNATQVWRNFECRVTQSNICMNVGRLTPSIYDEMNGIVNVSYGLHRYGPFLSDLVDCTFVRDTFTTIHDRHCPDLRNYSRWVFIGLAMVSVAVMLSLILWVLYARERRHRNYTKLVHASSLQTSFERKWP